MRIATNKDTQLYRLFDAEGRLLYVGVSHSAHVRFYQHKSGSEWSGLIEEMKVEDFATRKEALSAEKRAINYENPIYNKFKPIPDPCQRFNFKMDNEFVLSFKSRALQERLKLNELLEKAFAFYLEKAEP